MTAHADMPDAVGEHRHPYGPCHHTKYEGCPPCVHSAWDEGVQAARDAVAASDPYWKVDDGETGDVFVMSVTDALAAIDALRGSGNPHTPPSAEKGEQA